MKKFNYEDSDIENILQQMPEVRDNRKMLEILERAEKLSKKRKGLGWVMPAAASAAAILLFALISTSIFQNDRNRNTAGLNSKEDASTAAPIEKKASSTEKRFVIMPDQNFITFSITGMDQAGLIMPLNIPVSMAVEENASPAVLYTKYIDKMKNEQWGLAPLDFKNHATFSEASDANGNKTLVVDMIKNSSLGVSSAGTAFMDSLKESFRWHGYNQIEFQTQGQKGTILGNTEYTSIPLVAEGKKAYFQYIYGQDYPSFLVPSPDTYPDFSKALNAMESEQFTLQAPLHAPIPGGVDISNILIEGSHAEVKFTADSGLMDNETFVMMLDAILLSAKEFGFRTVTFSGAQNANIDQIGTIKLGMPNEVPAAPNPVQ
ncbi:hypothetical protein D0469_17175 [Peribacillus saganii]|uniref:GerMN domain-containing protein n=1 Tax=Peribacillus saganii TaxID=2303992 RepID=A0A372LK19_9BACI|nr:hypothetical protein [Peribacillus saganii]RFU66366.1 hypothetical protein D0469_17175 [Peribacillus saganii]